MVPRIRVVTLFTVALRQVGLIGQELALSRMSFRVFLHLRGIGQAGSREVRRRPGAGSGAAETGKRLGGVRLVHGSLDAGSELGTVQAGETGQEAA